MRINNIKDLEKINHAVSVAIGIIASLFAKIISEYSLSFHTILSLIIIIVYFCILYYIKNQINLLKESVCFAIDKSEDIDKKAFKQLKKDHPSIKEEKLKGSDLFKSKKESLAFATLTYKDNKITPGIMFYLICFSILFFIIMLILVNKETGQMIFGKEKMSEMVSLGSEFNSEINKKDCSLDNDWENRNLCYSLQFEKIDALEKRINTIQFPAFFMETSNSKFPDKKGEPLLFYHKYLENYNHCHLNESSTIEYNRSKMQNEKK